MEMGNLSVGSSKPARKVASQAMPPQGPTSELSTLDLVSCLTKGMANAAAEVLEKFVCPPPVSDAMDAALWERFKQ